MASLIGSMNYHIDGHKELTETNEIIKIDVDEVAVCLATGSHKGEVEVKVGDYVKIGDLLGKRNDHFYVPFFSPVSGTVKAIEDRPSARMQMTPHVIIENDHKDEKVVLNTVSLESDGQAIIDFMKEIGLLGQGGAGFPTYIKYNTDKCETLLINAVECEPYITADVRNIEENKDLFELGVRLMFKASNAKKAYVCIKETHPELIKELKEVFNNEDIEVKVVRDVYPMGWERTLVYEVLKKRYDKLPIEVGAIVSNATSAITLAYAAKNSHPAYERIVTVSGDNINDPHNVLVRIGTPIKTLIEKCGGLKDENSLLVLGGPMMGASVDSDEISITPINNAIDIFKADELVEYECLKCGSCIDHCSSSLQPALINRVAEKNNLARLEKLNVMDCIECGLCSFVCPSKIPVSQKVAQAKAMLANRGN